MKAQITNQFLTAQPRHKNPIDHRTQNVLNNGTVHLELLTSRPKSIESPGSLTSFYSCGPQPTDPTDQSPSSKSATNSAE